MIRLFFVAIVLMSCISCDDFLKVDVTPSIISKDLIFSDDVTATAAVTGIYEKMFESGFANGDYRSVVAVAGLSADELDCYVSDPLLLQFEGNNLRRENEYVYSLWTSLYSSVYQANSVVEGLAVSKTVTSKIKAQLEGEALFIRAFCHFYLLNLFGDVPLVVSTDYSVNATVQRLPSADVYRQIVMDLQKAETLLSEQYVTANRVRPNRYAAIALLARVYLFLGEWENAEREATKVIGNVATYEVIPDLNGVFLSDSREAIWQLMPVIDNLMTLEGYYFVAEPQLGGVRFFGLKDELVNTFESGDNRLRDWIGEWISNDDTIKFPYKYKVAYNFSGVSVNEYSMVFRVAEQHLIRAEAYSRQGKLLEAIGDLDVIRGRAGLALVQNSGVELSVDSLLAMVYHERQAELFTEWGHRWFDLKRLEKVTAILEPVKSDWSANDQLYPIPQTELNDNPNLGLQNPGYQQ